MVCSSSLENISREVLPCPREDHVQRESVGREIKHEMYERSREFLSAESKLKWEDSVGRK